MADQKELLTLELKAMIRKIETFRTSLPDKLRIMQRFYDAVFEAGMRAGEIARTERSDKDYAIEHAEYLAKAAEHLMDEINKYDMAESTDDECDCDARSDAWNGLRSAIGEFRKRAKRALPAAPEEKP